MLEVKRNIKRIVCLVFALNKLREVQKPSAILYGDTAGMGQNVESLMYSRQPQMGTTTEKYTLQHMDTAQNPRRVHSE